MLGGWNQRHRRHVGIQGHADLEQPFLAMGTLMSQQGKLIWEDKREIKAGTEMRDPRLWGL